MYKHAYIDTKEWLKEKRASVCVCVRVWARSPLGCGISIKLV